MANPPKKYLNKSNATVLRNTKLIKLVYGEDDITKEITKDDKLSSATKQNKDEHDAENRKKKKINETNIVQRNISGGAVLSLQVSHQSQSAQTTQKTLAKPELEISQALSVKSVNSTLASDITSIQVNLQSIRFQSSKAHKQLSLKLYLSNPRVYKMLYEELSAAPVSELKDVFQNTVITTDKITAFPVYLTQKVATLTFKQKQCFLCIGEIKIKPRLYYDIKKDIILGLHDLENDLKEPKAAERALFIIAQGIYQEWKQPVAISYVGSDVNEISFKMWVSKNIKNLIDIGFNIRAIVFDRESNLFSNFPEGYFLSRYQIYCFEDISSLFKRIYYTFTKNNFVVDGGIATIQHIERYYKTDIKTKVPLTPNLRYKDVKPSSQQDLDITAVMEVINNTTAAAISTYMQFEFLDESATHTVKLITKLRKFYDIITTRLDEQSKIKKDFPSKENIEILNEILSFIGSLKPVKQMSKPTSNVVSYQLLVKHFKSFVIYLKKLKDDMLQENGEYLPFWRLNSDASRLFANQVKKHSKSITKPTAKEVDSIFKQIAVINFLKDTTKASQYINVENVLSEYQCIMSGYKLLDDNYYVDTTENLIKSSEYNALRMERKDGIIFLSGFLLQMCVKTHQCIELTQYNTKSSYNVENQSMYESIMDDVKKNICVVPSTEFIEFVETMELIFKNFMNSNKLLGDKRKVLLTLMGSLDSLNPPNICECFPLKYVQKLYVRFRIYHTLKYNNELIRTKNMRRIIVNKL